MSARSGEAWPGLCRVRSKENGKEHRSNWRLPEGYFSDGKNHADETQAVHPNRCESVAVEVSGMAGDTAVGTDINAEIDAEISDRADNISGETPDKFDIKPICLHFPKDVDVTVQV